MKETNIEYAQALFAIAKENNSILEYSECLKEISDIVEENAEYTEFLDSPAIPLLKRLDAVDEAFKDKMPEHIVSFLKVLINNGRIRALKECIEEFMKLEMLESNALNVCVYSSVPLSEEQKEKLIKKLENKYKKTVDATFSEDKSLISGIKIVIEDEVLDGSIKKRLKNLKEVIK
ncbi:MAG: ATP synthase F1 subunit delta [Clostridia bacterium]|nr:ATP synthase F1 subunit delta [Clostridia bacterium]